MTTGLAEVVVICDSYYLTLRKLVILKIMPNIANHRRKECCCVMLFRVIIRCFGRAVFSDRTFLGIHVFLIYTSFGLWIRLSYSIREHNVKYTENNR